MEASYYHAVILHCTLLAVAVLSVVLMYCVEIDYGALHCFSEISDLVTLSNCSNRVWVAGKTV